jgi:hypothetical protein
MNGTRQQTSEAAPGRPGAPAADGRAAAPRAGRILRVKQGYNPNSSSVGSAIPLFLAAAVSAGAVTVFLLNLFSSAGGLLRRQRRGPRQAAADARGEVDDGT